MRSSECVQLPCDVPRSANRKKKIERERDGVSL